MIAELECYGITAERKSIYDDIEALRQYGIDIATRKTKTTDYFVANRLFELPELKLLVDIVQSSKFITHKKSNDLISMPYTDPMDTSFRRLQYVRYADDFIIGIIGSKQDATVVKEDIGKYLSEKLCLELSDEKTLITNATEKARFLSFDIRATPQSNHTKKTKRGITARNYGGHIMLEVPTPIIQKKLLELGAMEILVQNGTEVWKPVYRGALMGRTDLSILDQYNGEIRGFCNYYSIANNRSKLHKFRYIMEYSMYKTYACKYRTTKKAIIERYRINKDFGVKFQDKHGKERVRLLWKGSLARKDFPLGQEADIIHKPKGILKKPTLAMRL